MGPRTVPEILRSDAETYERKARDYASGADPFENFVFAAAYAERRGGIPGTPRYACLILQGVKISRLMTLGAREAANESVLDTMRDLRVYLGIEEGMLAITPAYDQHG